jgi:hypothetical protein
MTTVLHPPQPGLTTNVPFQPQPVMDYPTHQPALSYLPLLPNPSPVEQPLEIYTRPEIRTGCIWEIQLRFSQQMREMHNLRHIYLEKPRASSLTCA